MWHSAGDSRSDRRTFLGLYLYLAGRRCKNPLSARGTAQCKSAPGITSLVNITGCCTIFHNDSSPPCQFLRTKYLKKKARENAH